MVLVLLTSTIVLISMIQNIDQKLVLYGDSFQYWAAGRLFLAGENPYDYDNVAELRKRNGYKNEIAEDAISMMLYPPMIFPILVPFSIFSYSTSRMIWLFFFFFFLFLA